MSKTWFITGANRGLGKEFAEGALNRGDRVIATSRKLEALDDLVRRFGDLILPLSLDVKDEAASIAAVKAGHQKFGTIDVVVNNAGYGLFGAIEEVSTEEFREQIDVNLMGTFFVTKAVLPLLRAQGHGHIIQVSSMAGVSVLPRMGAYCASKWALEALSEALASEVAEFGIKVTLVEPGPYSTDFGYNSSINAQNLPQYDGLREQAAALYQQLAAIVSDPKAVGPAMLKLVDAEEPPMRVFFGASVLSQVEQIYADRLDTWREWQDLSILAHGQDA